MGQLNGRVLDVIYYNFFKYLLSQRGLLRTTVQYSEYKNPNLYEYQNVKTTILDSTITFPQHSDDLISLLFNILMILYIILCSAVNILQIKLFLILILVQVLKTNISNKN